MSRSFVDKRLVWWCVSGNLLALALVAGCKDGAISTQSTSSTSAAVTSTSATTSPTSPQRPTSPALERSSEPIPECEAAAKAIEECEKSPPRDKARKETFESVKSGLAESRTMVERGVSPRVREAVTRTCKDTLDAVKFACSKKK